MLKILNRVHMTFKHLSTTARWSTVVFLVVFFLSPLSVYALSYSVAPRIIDLTIEPRDIIEQKIVITNNESSIITLFPSVNNVTVGLEGGVEAFVPPSMSDRTTSFTSWFETQRSGIELRPHESKEIPLTIRVNPNAGPGAYHALIAYAPGQTIDDAQRLIESGNVPSVLINATIEEAEDDYIDLSRFIVKKFITAFHEGDVTYTIKNSGDTELSPHGDVVIYNQRGEEVASLPVNPEKKTIKPGDQVVMASGVPVDGLLGKYKAFLTIRYGKEEAAVYDTAFFYVFPWKKVAIGFTVVIVTALLFALWLHRRLAAREDSDEDGTSLPVFVRDTVSGAHHKDVVMKK